MVNSQVTFPEDWKRRTLSELIDGGFQNGLFFEVDRKNKGVPIINVGDLYGDVPISNRMALFDATLEEIKSFGVKSGDVFFTRSSIVPSGIAMCNVYLSEEEKPVVFDSHVIKYSANRKQVNPVYLALQCRMPFARNHLIGRAKTATMTTIDQKGIGSCPIYMPDVPEQDAIVDTLATFDAYIANLSELIDKKKAIRDGALEDLVSGRTRLAGFMDSWIEVPFSKVIVPKARIGWQGLRSDEYLRKGYSYLIGGTDFYNGTISLNDIWFVAEERYQMDSNIQVSSGDVLVTKDGTIGKVAMVPTLDKPATLNSGVYVFRTKNGLERGFLYRILQSTVFRKFIDTLAAGSTIMHLYQKDLKKFVFMMPKDTEEQKAISNTLSSMDDEITALEDERNKMNQIREGAMDDLLTGRVRLPI